MFTGIVEELGGVVGMERLPDDSARITVRGLGASTVDAAEADML